jgi:hypothetical protein
MADGCVVQCVAHGRDPSHQEDDTVALRFHYRLAAAACLGLSGAAGAADFSAVKPAVVAASPDQQLAEAVAGRLAQSGNLKGYRVEVTCDAGLVELTGAVRDQSQKDEVGKIVRSVKGVKKIDNKLELAKGDIQKTQAETLPSPIGNVMPGPNGGGAPGPMLGGQGMPGPIGGNVGNAMPMPGPGPMPHGGMGGYAGSDPTPIGMNPTGGLYDNQPPRMPPYAWPTYAPYNNYSRVGYPTEYPQDAFPFIGPFYPFPKVPLGWRSVTLEWQDGHWYYGRNATQHDYWRVRYW